MQYASSVDCNKHCNYELFSMSLSFTLRAVLPRKSFDRIHKSLDVRPATISYQIERILLCGRNDCSLNMETISTGTNNTENELSEWRRRKPFDWAKSPNITQFKILKLDTSKRHRGNNLRDAERVSEVNC